MSPAELAHQLVIWWARAGAAPDPGIVFSADFEFSTAFGACGLGDFLSSVKGQGTFRGITITHVVADAASVAVFFEGLDEVTGLEHRIAWVISLDASGAIRRIYTTSSAGYPPDECDNAIM
jgi:hypothetical protein